MSTTLPELTRTIDDAFTHTWYEIRDEAIDNILDATPVWAALRSLGCFHTQVGGLFISETIRYGTAGTQPVVKGSVFSQGEPKLTTMARWDWKYLSAHAQRSIIDDQQNNGKFKIRSLVMDKLEAAREALVEEFEARVLSDWSTTAETTDITIQGLKELVPPTYSTSTAGYGAADEYTYGHIDRPGAYSQDSMGNYTPTSTNDNPWWGPKYRLVTAPMNVNLISDMTTLYNSIGDNKQPPKLIVCDQTMFEAYGDFALDASQIVKDAGTHLADLGFDVFRFNGKPMFWSPNMYDSTNSKSHMKMLNTDFIKVVYDPQMWFDTTEWKYIALGGERIAHIMCALNIIGNQARRHGELYEA